MELVATCRNSSSLLQICQLRKAYSHPLAKVLSQLSPPAPCAPFMVMRCRPFV